MKTTIAIVLLAASVLTSITLLGRQSRNIDGLATAIAAHESRIAHLERTNRELVAAMKRATDVQIQAQNAHLKLQAEFDRATGR